MSGRNGGRRLSLLLLLRSSLLPALFAAPKSARHGADGGASRSSLARISADSAAHRSHGGPSSRTAHHTRLRRIVRLRIVVIGVAAIGFAWIKSGLLHGSAVTLVAIFVLLLLVLTLCRVDVHLAL